MVLAQRARSILVVRACLEYVGLSSAFHPQKNQDEKLIASSTGMDKLGLSTVISWVLKDTVYDWADCALYKGAW